MSTQIRNTIFNLGEGSPTSSDSWQTWLTQSSVSVEDAAPNSIILTAPSARTLTKDDFSIAGKTISSGAWIGNVLTLVLSADIEPEEAISLVLLKNSGYTKVVTNNLSWSAYWTQQSLRQKILKTFSASDIVAYFPIDEPSGVTMTDVVNAHNGAYGNVTLGSTAFEGKTTGLWGATSYGNIFALNGFMNKNEGSIILWMKVGTWIDDALHYVFSLWSSADSSIIELYKGNSGSLNKLYFSITRNGVQKTAISTAIEATSWVMLAVSWSLTNDRIRGYINSAPFGQANSVAGMTSYIGDFRSDLCGLGSQRGSSAISNFPANYSNILVLNREVTETELNNLFWNNHVVFDGDSRTDGKSYPGRCLGANTFAPRIVGKSGQTVAQRITAAATAVDPYFRSGKKNIYVIWGGVNDGGDAQVIYDRLKTICLGRKAKGYKTIVCTEIDAQDAARNAVNWHTVAYPALNALLAADHSFADGYADLGANVNLQDATNLTYFNADKVHLTEAGYAEVASVVAPIITGLLQ